MLADSLHPFLDRRSFLCDAATGLGGIALASLLADAGTLVLDGAQTLLAGSSLTIGSAAPGAIFSPPSAAANANNLAPVPEPGTCAMLLAAAIAAACLRRRPWRR